MVTRPSPLAQGLRRGDRDAGIRSSDTDKTIWISLASTSDDSSDATLLSLMIAGFDGEASRVTDILGLLPRRAVGGMTQSGPNPGPRAHISAFLSIVNTLTSDKADETAADHDADPERE